MTLLCYRRHCFPAEIIQRAIWLYLRSPARSGHAKAALGWPCRNPRRPSMGFVPENQVRTELPAGGRWIRTIGPRHERGGFCCGRRIAGPNGGSQKGLFLMRYRWFESISLQRGVYCEPVQAGGCRPITAGGEDAEGSVAEPGSTCYDCLDGGGSEGRRRNFVETIAS